MGCLPGIVHKGLKYRFGHKDKSSIAFFLGDAMYNKDNMKGAKTELNQFLAMADDMKGLPPQSGIAAGNYDLGYIYLKEENYVESLKYFEKAIAGFKNVRSSEDPFVGSRLLPDATLRREIHILKRIITPKQKNIMTLQLTKNIPTLYMHCFKMQSFQDFRAIRMQNYPA